MELQEYLQEMKLMQNNILSFLENNGDVSDVYQNIITLLDGKDVHHHKHKIKSILYLISKISNNHHRSYNFFNKIGEILHHLQHRIKHFFSNDEIFNIFKSNKRLLLYLFQEKFITADENIAEVMVNGVYKNANYDFYFFPELEPFLDESIVKDMTEKIPEDFEEKRKVGENDDYVCEIIRKDFIHEFIDYSKKNKLHLDAIIQPSVYETNNLLLKRQVSLIEYAAFFGSIQIFKYLYQHLTQPLKSTKISLKSPFWLFGIHSLNPEMIHFLRGKHFKLKHKYYAICLKEAIKCHHNATANFIQESFIDTEEDNHVDIFSIGLQYYNFYFIQNDFTNGSVFYHLCEYDYYPIVHILLKTKENIFSKHRQSSTRGLFILKIIFFFMKF